MVSVYENFTRARSTLSSASVKISTIISKINFSIAFINMKKIINHLGYLLLSKTYQTFCTAYWYRIQALV